MKRQGSTLFLRLTVIILGMMALGLCILILPAIYSGWTIEYPDVAYLQYPALVILAATTIPFYAALYQTWSLLGYIDKNTAFSARSVDALKKIKYSAVAFSGLYVAFLPIVYHVADHTDAPGVMGIGMMMVCAPIVIAVFAAVLQMLLQSAIAMKSENDLTV